MATASTSATWNYFVFLSFRGEDTRDGFVSHLYNALRAKWVKTFIDENLPKGGRIDELFQVIEQSKICIVVYSENYASSEWCLSELAKILECTKDNKTGRFVLPVFYKVHPSELKRQGGITGDHLARHELKYREDTAKVALWRAALKDLADIAGWHFKHGSESELVKDIITTVLSLLEGRSSCFAKESRRRKRSWLLSCFGITSSGLSERPRVMRYKPLTYAEILKLTRNLETVIGEGGYGKVYLGTLSNGAIVAVKMISNLTSRDSFYMFRAQIPVLMPIHHKNLVSLVGYCEDCNTMALIYEFMANGSVRQHLLDTNPNILTWKERLRISIEVAQGLDYLHNHVVPSMIHPGMTTKNILLNENMEAKIDFGILQNGELETDDHGFINTRSIGTIGYDDPEIFSSGDLYKLNKKSNIYSLGVVLFELVTGRLPIMRSSSGITLITEWVEPLIEKGDIEIIVDQRLGGKFSISSAQKVSEIAKSCVQRAAERPDISCVLKELKDSWEIEMTTNEE